MCSTPDLRRFHEVGDDAALVSRHDLAIPKLMDFGGDRYFTEIHFLAVTRWNVDKSSFVNPRFRARQPHPFVTPPRKSVTATHTRGPRFHICTVLMQCPSLTFWCTICNSKLSSAIFRQALLRARVQIVNRRREPGWKTGEERGKGKRGDRPSANKIEYMVRYLKPIFWKSPT